ncbi:hypothetical protein KIM67_07035 [Flagellimonas sp. 389]|nr:hypothetical protein [uncultured Allomuricauda sp.]MBS9462159.1 hypothetical protein [Flagellimonas sp. 389]
MNYDQQKAMLPNFVVVQDEVIADFDDSFLLLPELIEKRYLNNSCIANIIRCHNLIGLVTRNPDKDAKSYEKNENLWKKIRFFAKDALDELIKEEEAS